MSLYNAEGEVLWLSEGALGPDEHSVVLDAMQTLQADIAKGYHETGLDDGRFGMFLPVRAPRGDLVGIVMLLTELKTLPEGIADQLMCAKVRSALQKIAVFLRVGSTRAGDTTTASAFPPVPALEETVIAPARVLTAPVVAPASTADVAADLSLSVQELVKLRSSGRTRRYEVLARSRRDPDRDEVPAAFVAQSANGRQGAMLDDVVVQRLFAWLANHPQIWDGEPASFSVNLSIGALEDEHFLRNVAGGLKTANIPPESIGFEITEFACVQCKKQVQRFLADCEKLGCFVVLDNFSFDSAAVPLLGSKAIRMVKIDPKLTAAAMKEKLPQAVVIAISQACKVLGIHCIAKKVGFAACARVAGSDRMRFCAGICAGKTPLPGVNRGPLPDPPPVTGEGGEEPHLAAYCCGGVAVSAGGVVVLSDCGAGAGALSVLSDCGAAGAEDWSMEPLRPWNSAVDR